MQYDYLPTVSHIKRYLSFTLVGLMLVLPVHPAAANDTAPKPGSAPAPAAAPAFSCTGHLDQPMTEAFYTHCLAPTEGPPAMQADSDMEHAPATKCAATPDHTEHATCDQRPGTIINPPTPRDGSAMQFISLEPVPFEFDKAVLTDAAIHSLDAITAYLRSQPGVTSVLVYGHTDNVGTGNYNYTLSDKRIHVITAYLVGHGIAPSLIHEAPRGERMPVDEYWTPDGRKRNRRVEVYAVVR